MGIDLLTGGKLTAGRNGSWGCFGWLFLIVLFFPLWLIYKLIFKGWLFILAFFPFWVPYKLIKLANKKQK